MHEQEVLRGVRRALLLDAAASGAMGVLLAMLAGPLAGVLGLPVGLLRWAGLALLPFAGSLAYLATRNTPSIGGISAVITCNLLWVGVSLLLPVSGWVSPTPFGTAFILAQAGAVASFAGLQVASLRPLLRPRFGDGAARQEGRRA